SCSSLIIFNQPVYGIRYDLVTGVQTCALPILKVSPFSVSMPMVLPFFPSRGSFSFFSCAGEGPDKSVTAMTKPTVPASWPLECQIGRASSRDRVDVCVSVDNVHRDDMRLWLWT